MEIHAFVPPVARTGVVPAVLFFGLALKFPPVFSIPAILCADAWLAAVMTRSQASRIVMK